MTDGQRALAHPWIVAAVAVVALAGAWIVAVQRPVTSWELSATTWFNDAPEWVAHTLWPVMQLGSVFGPVAGDADVVIGGGARGDELREHQVLEQRPDPVRRDVEAAEQTVPHADVEEEELRMLNDQRNVRR